VGRVPLTDFTRLAGGLLPMPLCGRSTHTSTVVVSTPSLALRPRIVEAHEPVRVQALRPELPVQALDERVVRRLARPGEIERHPALVGPEIQLA
jgi:hypothetical protein